MTVKELIEKLQTVNPYATVHLHSEDYFDDGDGYVDTIPSDVELKEVIIHDGWILLKPVD